MPSSDSDIDENTRNYSTGLRKREEVLLNLPPLRVQIAIAQQVLLLLPRRYFSMLLCLLTFFATLQICPNELTPKDIGRMFSGAIVGGRARKGELAQDEEPRDALDAPMRGEFARRNADVPPCARCTRRTTRAQRLLCPPAAPVRTREAASLQPRAVGLGLELHPPQIDLPENVLQGKLFDTTAPFDFDGDGEDDVNIYSTDARYAREELKRAKQGTVVYVSSDDDE